MGYVYIFADVVALHTKKPFPKLSHTSHAPPPVSLCHSLPLTLDSICSLLPAANSVLVRLDEVWLVPVVEKNQTHGRAHMIMNPQQYPWSASKNPCGRRLNCYQ